MKNSPDNYKSSLTANLIQQNQCKYFITTEAFVHFFNSSSYSFFSSQQDEQLQKDLEFAKNLMNEANPDVKPMDTEQLKQVKTTKLLSHP